MSYYDNATLMTLKLGPWQTADTRQVTRSSLRWLGVPLFSRRLRRPGLFSLRGRTQRPVASGQLSRHR